MPLTKDKNLNYRICEDCNAIYSTGKEYGNVWQKSDIFNEYTDCEKKGQCEFCNPNHYSYQVKHKLVPRNEKGIPLSALNVPENGYTI
jgi:hypothetical protein